MRDIKRRISSFKNMQQITKAMEMVSAAKLRRAQNQVTASRPFAGKLRDVLVRLVTSIRSSDAESVLSHPLLQKRESRRVLYVVVTADRGLAGGYNANIVRRVGRLLREETREIGLVAIGRKGRDYIRKTDANMEREYIYIGDEVEFSLAREIANELMSFFTSGEYDEIHLVYTQFISAISQKAVIEQVLPIDDPTEAEGSASVDDGAALDYIYEPDKESVLNILLPRYVETEVYRALMEAKASEHGARMTAMRSASDNADELIDGLTLTFNRARQASITKEISEIVGGAEALSAGD